jgi:hypothetical protein
VSRALLALLASVATAIVAVAACQDLPNGPVCGEIPGQGCPVDIGGTCQDQTCSAIYECENGQWVLLQQCPAHEGGTGGGGGGDAGSDGGPCAPLTVDAGAPGFDCMPDLISPDCALDAVTCPDDTACFTGCTDFFVCSAGPCGGPGPCWIDVAYCDDFGHFVPTGA